MTKGAAYRSALGAARLAAMGRRALGSGLTLVAGAAAYALLQGVLDVRFAATPLALGVVALAAGALGSRRRVVGTGAVLAGWGLTVLLVDQDIVPAERTTPAYMLGIATGLLVTAALADRRERAAWLTSGAIAAFTGPLALYLSYDVAAFGRWPLWAVALLAWAAWELFWGLRSRAPAPAGAADG